MPIRREILHDLAWTLVAVMVAAIPLAFGYVRGDVGTALLAELALVVAAYLSLLLAKPAGAALVVAPAFLLPNGTGPVPLGALTLALALAYWRFGAGRPRLPLKVLAAVAVLAVFLLFSPIYTPGSSGAQGMIGIPMLWAAGVILGASVAADRRGLLAIGAFCVFPALLALWEVSGHENPWTKVVGVSAFVELTQVEGQARALATFEHPLVAGGVLAIVAVLLVGTEHRWRNVLIGILLAGSLATVSRSAMLGIAAAAVVMVMQSGRRWPRVVGGITGVAAIGWVLIVAIPSLSQSLTARIDLARTSSQPVRDFAQQSLSTYLHAPEDHLFGHGFGSSQQLLEYLGGVYGFHIFDNWYATSLYELGVIPLAFGLVMVLWSIRWAEPSARRIGLPALVTALILMYFTDGMYRSALALAAAMTIGVVCFPRERVRVLKEQPLPMSSRFNSVLSSPR